MRFSRIKRYSCRHSLFWPLQGGFRYPFTADQNAPLPSIFRYSHSLGDGLEPRWIVSAEPLDQ